jgi:membrane protease subunit HflC
VQSENGARTRLDDVLDSAVRDVVSGSELAEIVRSADWKVDKSQLREEDVAAIGADELAKPKKGRGQLEKDILATATQQMPNIGIELVDVRIKRINYIDSVGKQVEDRMIAERQSIAARFRSEGQGRSEEILGNMQRELQRIASEAARQAQEIRGRADAEATKIYGDAYGQDPAFYSLSKTLDSYSTLGENTTLMIDAKSEFFRYLQSSQGR